MENKRVLIFSKGIDDVLFGKSNVAGIEVQMSMWAREFVRQGWRVFALSDKEDGEVNGISFIGQMKNWLDRHKLSMVNEFVFGMRALRRAKADILLFRGASRYIWFLTRACRVCGTKLVFMGASDTDFVKGKELVSGAHRNVVLYRRSLRRIEWFVTQNKKQAEGLQRNYGKESLIVPNVWLRASRYSDVTKRFDAVWVANMRRLKRVEWFIGLAERMKDKRFAIVGGPCAGDDGYYATIERRARSLDNVTFFGAQPLEEVNGIVCQSRMLVCTSEFEGFPNTFLQAWAADVPVVSTVDPNNVITDKELGIVVGNEDDLFQAVVRMTEDSLFYGSCVDNVKSYFEVNHNAGWEFGRLMDYIYKKKL